jgi:hypothetical protein
MAAGMPARKSQRTVAFWADVKINLYSLIGCGTRPFEHGWGGRCKSQLNASLGEIVIARKGR